jgi:hypothetical protein
LLQLAPTQHFYCKCIVHYQERESLGILVTDTHGKDAVLFRLASWGEFINNVRARLFLLGSDVIAFIFIGIAWDWGFPDSFRLNLQHVDARSVGIIVCSVQISEINGRVAILLDILLCLLVVDILDARNTTHNSLYYIFIRPYHRYLREVSRVLISLVTRSAGDKIIYQNRFLGLQHQNIRMILLLPTCLDSCLLWDL